MPATQTTEKRPSQPLTAADEIASFVRDLVFDMHQWDGVERRAEPRFAISVPVEVTPYEVDPLAGAF